MRARVWIGIASVLGVATLAPASWIARTGTLPPSTLAPVIAALYPDVRSIGTTELDALLRGPHPPLLLDARTPEEMAISRLPGAEPIGRGPRDHDGPVVVYCSIGWRSAGAARELAERGARDVRNLEGGIFAWANEGRPVHRGDRVVNEVHPYDGLWSVFLEDGLEASTRSQEDR